MKLTKIQLAYDTKFTTHDCDVVLKFFPDATFIKSDKSTDELPLFEINYSGRQFLVDLESFVKEYPHQFLVLGMVTLPTKFDDANLEAMTNFTGVIDNMTKLAERITTAVNNSVTFNEKCHVHVGGSTLISVNETKLLECSCTDNLQQHLDEGWRIVACCVQPDGRRPDYVIGRYNQQRDM